MNTTASRLGLWSFLTVFGFSTSVLYSQSKDIGSDEEQLIEMEAFTVTGSRIPRLEVEPVNPVLTVTAEDLLQQGALSAADALRASSLSNGISVTTEGADDGFAQGVATANLRGLGINNTLVLINGRRAAAFGEAGFNGFVSVFDLSTIPTAAISKIEILKDGASAIYGSDAVAGVISVDLVKQFEGVSTSVTLGNFEDTDAFLTRGSVVAGTTTDRFSALVLLDYSHQNGVFYRDYERTSNGDQRANGGADFRSTIPYPGTIDSITFAEPTTTPTLANAVPNDQDTVGRYNFNQELSLQPESYNRGVYSYLTFEIVEDLTAYAELSFRSINNEIVSAPTPLVGNREQGDSLNGFIQLPGTFFPAPGNPFSPNFFASDFNFTWRMTELGNRINEVTTEFPRAVVGLQGEFLTTFTWDVGVTYNLSKVRNEGRNFTSDRLVQDALNGVMIDGELLHANPFGPSDPRVIDYLRVTNTTEARYRLRSADFTVAGRPFEWSGGWIGFSAGGEYREEVIDDRRSQLNATGQIVGGREVGSIFAKREVRSAYTEVAISPHRSLEFQVAARHESYSDFGTTNKPKFAVKWQPLRWLLLRASYSESFLAPSLPYLFGEVTTTFSDPVIDPQFPSDPPESIPNVGGGNPDLQPEETTVYYVGLALQPTLFDGRLSFQVEYFHYDQIDLINRLSVEFLLANEDLFPDQVNRAPNPSNPNLPGEIISVDTVWQNLDEQTLQVWDFRIDYESKPRDWGAISVTTTVTYTQSLELNGAEFAGEYNNSEFRGNLNVAYSLHDFIANAFLSYIGPYDNLDTSLDPDGDIEDDTRLNLAFSYNGFEDVYITLGINNVFDSPPPFDPSNAAGYNDQVSSLRGRFYTLNFRKDW